MASWWRTEGVPQIAKHVLVNYLGQSAPAAFLLARMQGARSAMEAPDTEEKATATYCRSVFDVLAPACPPHGRVL